MSNEPIFEASDGDTAWLEMLFDRLKCYSCPAWNVPEHLRHLPCAIRKMKHHDGKVYIYWDTSVATTEFLQQVDNVFAALGFPGELIHTPSETSET